MRTIQKKGGDVFLYIVVSAWVFVITLTALNLIGAVPYYMDGTPSNATLAELQRAKAEREAKRQELEREAMEEHKTIPILPERLEIPSAGVKLPVANPNTTDVNELDKQLLTSVVRYPGSGTLGVDGNMLIFGHSTGYKTVHNQMFKAFNSLKKLHEGNIIKLYANGKEYVYAVRNLKHEDASDVTVEFNTEPGVQMLTLSTCDSFGKKSERYIITADFIGSYDEE